MEDVGYRLSDWLCPGKSTVLTIKTQFSRVYKDEELMSGTGYYSFDDVKYLFDNGKVEFVVKEVDTWKCTHNREFAYNQ